MLTLLITLQCISIVGLVVLLFAKRWEMAHGRVLLSGVRPGVGRVLGGALHFVEAHLPALMRQGLLRAYAILRALTHRAVAWAVLHTERILEHTLRNLRGATERRSEGEVSNFLREVAEHKKALQEETPHKRNAIYEE